MRNSKPIWLLITCITLLIVLIVLTIISCEEAEKEPPDKAKELLEQTEALKIKQEERQAELDQMSVQQIVAQLQIESAQQIEPFNSIAYAEIVSRGTKITPELKRLIVKPDPTLLLSLLALREISPDTYITVEVTVRIEILVGSLKISEYFNTWGIPHLYWEQAAMAIIEHKKVAVDALIPLLRDKRPAPVWGSEEVLEYQKYQYRVCDYAMALISTIIGEKMEIMITPKARDEIIDNMVQELGL